MLTSSGFAFIHLKYIPQIPLKLSINFMSLEVQPVISRTQEEHLQLAANSSRHSSNVKPPWLRAALHYVGEVHRLVKSFSPRHGYLRQGMVCQRRWKDNRIFYSSWSSLEVKFLVRGFEVAQETQPPENSPSRKCPPRWHPCHFFIHVQCSPPTYSWL